MSDLHERVATIETAPNRELKWFPWKTWLYNLSLYWGQIVFYAVLALLLGLAVLPLTIKALTGIEYGITSVLMSFGITIFLGFKLIKVKFPGADEVIVLSCSALKGTILSRKIRVPEQSGEEEGKHFVAGSPLTFDAGFIAEGERRTWTFIPWWTTVYARVPTRVQTAILEEDMLLKEEIAVTGGTTSPKARRTVKITIQVTYVIIAELAGEFIGKFGKNCEKQPDFEKNLKSQISGKVREAVAQQTSLELDTCRVNINSILQGLFGGLQGLSRFEHEYGVTVKEPVLAALVLVGSEADADALRRIGEKQTALEEKLRTVREHVNGISGLTPEQRAKMLATQSEEVIKTESPSVRIQR